MRSARLWAALWLLCTPAVLWAVPHSMSYQALLKTSAGIPVANGFHVVTFSLYRSSAGGSALWTEIQTVATQGGVFSTNLGSTVPIPDSAFADTAAYLQLAVASDPPLSPRIRLVSTPFSMTSSSVRGGGPVDLMYEDLLNDELNTYSVDVTPPPGGAQGKGIRKNITVNLRTHQSSKRESMAVDSGYVTRVDISEGDDSLQYLEIAHIESDELVQSGQAVAIPAFMKNARKAKTAEAASSHEILDTDSGYQFSTVLSTTTGVAHWLQQVSPPEPSGGVAIPKFIHLTNEARSSRSASSREILDSDSGHSVNVALTTGTGTVTHIQQIMPPEPSGGVAIPKFLNLTNEARAGRSASSREILDSDSGHSVNIALTTSTGTVTHFQQITPPEPSGGVAIPKFLNITEEAKGSRSASSREILDSDSGHVVSTELTTSTGTVSHLLQISPPEPSGGVAIPKFIHLTSDARGANGASAREILDTDSGYSERVTLETPQGTTELSVTATPSTSGAIAVPSLIESRKSSNGTASVEARGILDPDSGYSEVVSIETADLTTTHSHGSGHTREHVLLARQVGVPTGGTRTNQFATEITDDSAHSQWRWSETSMETSDVDLSVTGSEQTFMMSTKPAGATKWPNIVLKRGVSATEMIVSHSLAGTGNVIYATADASGARLGINTDNPSTEFHLVGSGCYTGTFGSCSDRRFKDHIATLRDPLTTLRKLRGVNFTWKQEEFPEHQFPSGQQVGLIAQEVESVVPGVVTTGVDGYKSVDYAKLVPLLIEAVKAQQRQIDELKEQLEGTGRLTSAGN